MMNDVIVALATAPMESAIALIRISGENSFRVIKEIFKKGTLLENGKLIEELL